VILLQFAPRITKKKGHLYHEKIGDAIQMLNVKLKVKQIGVTGILLLLILQDLNALNINLSIYIS